MAVMVGYLANFGIPRSGEVLRAATLTSYEKVPFEKGFGSIISERIADLLALFLIVLIALILQTDTLLTYFEANNINPVLSIFLLLLLIGLGTIGLYFVKKSNLPLIVRFKKMAAGLLEGMRSIIKMKKKWAFLFHTVFIWVMYVSDVLHNHLQYTRNGRRRRRRYNGRFHCRLFCDFGHQRRDWGLSCGDRGRTHALRHQQTKWRSFWLDHLDHTNHGCSYLRRTFLYLFTHF